MPKLLRALDDFAQSDMPEKKGSFWKLAGPGAVLVGLSIGAGESIIWPRIVAEHGAGMVWAAIVGVFLQFWINLEIGRWTVATGETVYTGYCRVWRGFAPLFILLTLLGWLAPGWGRASGLALKALLVGTDGYGSDTFWTIITFAAVSVVLFGPKLVYQSVERTIELLVAIVTIGLVIVAINVGSAEVWKDLGAGIVNVGYRDPNMSIKALFIGIVFAGAGGTANLFYTFYLRDKHIGMGALLPTMHNPLRGRSEKIPATGYQYPDTPENAARFRQWWTYLKQDQAIFFWGLNSLTILLFIFGALAVLHPRGIVPEKGTLIWDEAVILGEIWGTTGLKVFLVVGVATLFSTQLAVIDGVSRSLSDIIFTNFKGAQKRDLSWWYLLVAGSWILVGCVITFVMENAGVSDLGFLFNAAYMGGFAMAIYVPLTLYINLRYLPVSARPHPVCVTMMVLASLVYVGFAMACIIWEVASRLGG